MAIQPEVQARPAHAVLAPLDFEERSLDLAIEALKDIRECDEARIYIKWDRLSPHPDPTGDGVTQTRSDVVGVVAPLLYVCFSPSTVAKVEDLPRVHMAPDGKLYAAHAVCLASMPSGKLLEGQKLKDVVRRGVEEYLHRHNVAVTHFQPSL